MTEYRGYTITKTSLTIAASLHGGKGQRNMLKITDKNGNAIRNSQGDLPRITTLEGAKQRIRAEIAKTAQKEPTK